MIPPKKKNFCVLCLKLANFFYEYTPYFKFIIVSLHWLVDASSLITQPSCHPLTAPPSHRLIASAGFCVTSYHAALSSSSPCITLLSSCAGWLLCGCLLHRPLILLSRCPLILLLRVSWLLSGLHQMKLPPLDAPTSPPPPPPTPPPLPLPPTLLNSPLSSA